MKITNYMRKAHESGDYAGLSEKQIAGIKEALGDKKSKRKRPASKVELEKCSTCPDADCDDCPLED